MKAFTIALIICLAYATPVIATEQSDIQVSEKDQLLLSYLGFGMAWSNALCSQNSYSIRAKKTNDQINTVEVKWFYLTHPDWKNISNKEFIYLQWKKRSDFLSHVFYSERIIARDHVYTTEYGSFHKMDTNSVFCLRMKRIDYITDDFFANKNISSSISNEDYILMSYTSFISIWSNVIFKDLNTFNIFDIIKYSRQYFGNDNADKLKIYNDIIHDDIIAAKKFEKTFSIDNRDMQTHLDSTPLFRSWARLDRLAYEFFSKQVEKIEKK